MFIATRCERMLRKVLDEQLGMSDLNYEDDLIAINPDIPTEEVLMDVFEELGYSGKTPFYQNWTGTLKDLIVIAESNLNQFQRQNER